MTVNKNSDASLEIESKLAQALTLVNVLSNNHYHADEGLDEPFINHCDTGNLLWILHALLDEAYKEYLNLDLKGGEKNA